MKVELDFNGDGPQSLFFSWSKIATSSCLSSSILIQPRFNDAARGSAVNLLQPSRIKIGVCIAQVWRGYGEGSDACEQARLEVGFAVSGGV